MTYIKINEIFYPVIKIEGDFVDSKWDRRSSKAITLTMKYDEAINLFVDGISWFIVSKHDELTPRLTEQGEIALNENNEPIYDITENIQEYDNSNYCVAGPITDNRDETITVKMGTLTELEEAYAMLLGVAE